MMHILIATDAWHPQVNGAHADHDGGGGKELVDFVAEDPHFAA